MTDCQQRQESLQERVEQTHGTTMVEFAMSDNIVLAGQPQPEDWDLLARRGFSFVVNMRSDPARAAVQAENAGAAGLRSRHLPLPAYELEPEHLAQFRDIVAQARAEKTLIHCRTASRTALLWLLMRITYDGYSRAEADAELRRAGYGDDDLEVFAYCAEDYFERTVETEVYL